LQSSSVGGAGLPATLARSPVDRRPRVFPPRATAHRVRCLVVCRPVNQKFMGARFAQWTLDVRDVERMAEFWAAALGYRIDRSEDGSVHLRPDGPGRLSVWLQPTDEPKTGKNRDHPDLIATDGTIEAEILRLLALGASRADVGQKGDEGFTVLADPEGNEFCLLHRQSAPGQA
jgi:catechol 2,3-dioxygenase-like lactoylglutathione lyase family enzyme